MVRYKSVVMLLVSVIMLAACQPVSVEQAEAQLCTDLVHFKAAMSSVRALTPESTVDEAKAALDVASNAWDNVVRSAYQHRFPYRFSCRDEILRRFCPLPDYDACRVFTTEHAATPPPRARRS